MAFGCGDDEVVPTPPRPDGPPVVEIIELRPVGGPIWRPEDPPAKRSCLVTGSDPAGTVTVVLSETGSLDNFTLRPPRGCAGALQCGYVLLSVFHSRVGELDSRRLLFQTGAASTAISVPLGRLEMGERADLLYTVEVELRDDFGRELELDAGVSDGGVDPRLQDEESFWLCPMDPDAGPDGARDAAADSPAAVPEAGIPDAGSDMNVPDSQAVDGNADASADPVDAAPEASIPMDGDAVPDGPLEAEAGPPSEASMEAGGPIDAGADGSVVLDGAPTGG